MTYALHPEAAAEHRKQVAYYEQQQKGLGNHYHAAFLDAVKDACNSPKRYKVVHPPDIRRIGFNVFRFDLIYRDVGGTIHVLAVAHHRREPGYWIDRR